MRQRLTRHAWATTAPVPEQPDRCQWCGGRKRAIASGYPLDICDAGCAPNNEAPYVGHCQECGRQFCTGRKLTASPLCYECEQREIARVTQGSDQRERRYAFKRVGRGGWRE